MKIWTPQALYTAKPWVLLGVGAVLSIGAMAWSLSEGLWTVWRGFGCFIGAAAAIAGAAILQTRQAYRAASKWRREGRR